MITWILKTIICSALLLGVYFIGLEKETMHKFKRFYLLAGLVLSFLVPFITMTSKVPIKEIAEYTTLPNYNLPSFEPVQIAVSPEKHFSFADVLLLIYLLVTIVFLYRFMKNLFQIYSMARKYKWKIYSGAKLVLIKDHLIPHSFLSYIFLNKSDFENGKIVNEILTHELTHVKQKHSIDILCIEILLVLFWFNPVLYLYRKAIKLNHEFLADDTVIKKFHNKNAYQYLLINVSGQLRSSSITSQLNFLITKKRLLMMTRYTSAKMVILKQCLALVVFFTVILLFSTKETIGQVVQDTGIANSSNNLVRDTAIANSSNAIRDTGIVRSGVYAGGTKEGVSDKEMEEYHFLINRIMTPGMTREDFRKKITPFIRNQMEAIFIRMNFKQQNKETIVFLKHFPPLPRVVPTQTQFNNFKNDKIYGVWINEKKVNNNVLDNYSANDFAQVFISKLYGGAKKNRNYSYQVDLMTNDYYQAYYKSVINDKSTTMVFQKRRPIK